MKINRQGITRIVLVFRDYVIKIPNFLYQQEHFLAGCYANYMERHYYKLFSSMKNKNVSDLLAPSIWCSWFGLVQIQAKCEKKLEDLTDGEIEKYKDWCGTDSKKENFGIYKDRLVCLDYGK